MKKLLIATVFGSCVAGASLFSMNAFAQTASTATAPAKPAVTHTAKPKAKAEPHRRVVRRRVTRRKTVAAVPKTDPIPTGAVRWNCDENESFYIVGNMKRDQILTMNWHGKDYRLPREQTTTGADRFYDPASGMDLVVIPMKAMLFSDTGDRSRLADECKTQDMADNNTPAPTQSNALTRK
jgi:hypothetical protein